MTQPSTILITGGGTGLGYGCALDLAAQHPNYKIIIANRSPPKKPLPSNVTYKKLDLSSSTDVRRFVDDWSLGAIDALMCNAGLQFLKLEYNSEGIESTFAINHLGHALLFFVLKSRGFLADTCRIVNTASGTHDPAQKTSMPDARYPSAEEVAKPTDKAYKDDGRMRYSTSKLCNVLWTYALNRHIQAGSHAGKWTVTAFDPGLMPGTQLARQYPAFLQFLWNHVLPHITPLLRILMGSPNIHSVHDSGAALARLAVGEDVQGVTGVYFEGRKEIPSSQVSYDVIKQDDLWNWTVNYLARDETEKATFLSF